jgi:hypothetical protein
MLEAKVELFNHSGIDQEAIATANALRGNLAYVATAAVASHLKQEDKGTDTGK